MWRFSQILAGALLMALAVSYAVGNSLSSSEAISSAGDPFEEHETATTDSVPKCDGNRVIVRFPDSLILTPGHLISCTTHEVVGNHRIDDLGRRYGLESAVPLFDSHRQALGLPTNRDLAVEVRRRHSLRTARAEGGPQDFWLPEQIYLLTFNETNLSADELVAAYMASGLVVHAEPNLIFREAGIPPDDPFYTSEGTWKQPYPDLWGFHAIHSARAWNITTGSSGVTIGLVDSGLDYSNPDIGAGLWTNPGEIPFNGIDDDLNGYVDDIHGFDFTAHDPESASPVPIDLSGHGTNVFGVMSADTGNGFGVPGLGWQCRTMVARGLGDNGSGTLFDLVRAVAYTVDNGADVLNLSWGGEGRSELLETVINYADSSGVVIVAAAGNDGLPADRFIPGAYAVTVTVGAGDATLVPFAGSNLGPAVDLIAPGIDILTTRAAFTDPAGDGIRFVGDHFFRANGTSIAAPHVSASAALLIADSPNVTVDAVRCSLRRSCFDVGDVGVDAESGYGHLDSGALLEQDAQLGVRIRLPKRRSVFYNWKPIQFQAYLSGSGPFNWVLERGRGEFPVEFTVVDSGSFLGGGGSLETDIPSANLPVGIHTFRLSAREEGSAEVFEDRVWITVDNRRGRLSGRVVTSADGTPLPGTEVSAINADGIIEATIFTGSYGEYTFWQGLPEGCYFIKAGSHFTDFIPEYYDDAETQSSAQTVPVEAGRETSGIDFALTRRGSISGHIVNRLDGSPVSGSTVSIYYPAGTLMRELTTGTDGSYRATGLIEQHYFVGARHPESRYLPRYYQDAADLDGAEPVEVFNDQDTSGIDIALKRYEGVVCGTVRRMSDGFPIPGVEVAAVELNTRFRRTTMTVQGGIYNLDDLPPGLFLVVSGMRPPFRIQYHPLSPDAVQALPVEVVGRAPVTGIDFSLEQAGFLDMTGAAGDLTRPLQASVRGLAWSDLDRDEFPDLYAVSIDGRNRLLKNMDGSGVFEDQTESRGAAVGGLKTAVAAGDMNNDGWMDLHVPRFGPFGTVFPDALLVDDGNGAFQDATVSAGVRNLSEGIDCRFADFDNNGFLDLYVVNLFAENALFMNQGDGLFHRVPDTAGAAGSPLETTAAVAPCDYDLDGLTDILVVIDEFENSPRHNHLYRNQGNGFFVDMADEVGLDGIRRSICASWGDADNDGDPDLFIGGVDGDRLLENMDGQFNDISSGSGILSTVGARGSQWIDVNLDGLLDLFILRPGSSGNRLLINEGAFRFRNESIVAGLSAPGAWTAFAWADYDRDGDPDLALGTGSGTLHLLRNSAAGESGPGPAWVGLQFQGLAANRDGVGAAVSVTAGDRVIHRTTGPMGGPRNQSEEALLVGLGDFPDDFVTVTVNWPSGTHQVKTDVPVGLYVRIVEQVPPVWIVAGPGPLSGNPASVRSFLPGGREVVSARFDPFSTRGYGLNLACGDLDGDGRDEIVAGAGPSRWFSPHVRAFTAIDGPLAGGNFLAFGHSAYGVNVSCGDADGDGVDELAVSPGPGPTYGTTVGLYGYHGQGEKGAEPGFTLLDPGPFLPYGPAVRGGTITRWGDLDGNGLDELLTAPGPLQANGAHIRGWRMEGMTAQPLVWINFLAYEQRIRYGARLACGDLDGDGKDEIVTAPGPGPGYGPHLRVWRAGSEFPSPVLLAEVIAHQSGGYGARIACGDLDNDGRDEIIVVPGPDDASPPLVRAFRLLGSHLIPVDGIHFLAYHGMNGGAEVDSGYFHFQ